MSEAPESDEAVPATSLVDSITAELTAREKVIERDIANHVRARDAANVAIKALRAESAEVKRILAAATATKRTRAKNS